MVTPVLLNAIALISSTMAATRTITTNYITRDDDCCCCCYCYCYSYYYYYSRGSPLVLAVLSTMCQASDKKLLLLLRTGLSGVVTW